MSDSVWRLVKLFVILIMALWFPYFIWVSFSTFIFFEPTWDISLYDPGVRFCLLGWEIIGFSYFFKLWGEGFL